MREVSNSPSSVLPGKVATKLRIEQGAKPFPTEAPDADNADPHGSEFERRMALAEAGMAEYRGTLRALAG